MKWVVIAHCEAKNNGKMEQFTWEIAKFEYPHQAEEFIEKCLPQERRSSFEVIHKDDTPELKAKYSLGQEVFYAQDKYSVKKGEIITIYFDGTFNNIPKYEIEYNGNVYAEDDVFLTEQEARKRFI